MPEPRVAHLRHHPSSGELVFLATPPDLKTVMGKYGPARFTPRAGGGYDIPTKLVDQVTRFLEAHQCSVVDERALTGPVSPTFRHRPMPECPHCQAPAPATYQGEFCYQCGRKWEPIVVDFREENRSRSAQDCSSCGTRIRGGSAHCPRCGATLTAAAVPAQPALPLTPREPGEPTRLADVLARLAMPTRIPGDFDDRVKFFTELRADPTREPRTSDEARWLAQLGPQRRDDEG